MKKIFITASMLVVLFTTTSPMAEPSGKTNNPIITPLVFDFDVTQVKQGLKWFELDYEIRCPSWIGRSRIDLLTQNSFDAGFGPCSFEYHFAGYTAKEGSQLIDQDAYKLLKYLVDEPTQPLCNLDDLKPGKHTIIFGLEQTYDKKTHEPFGDYQFLLCKTN